MASDTDHGHPEVGHEASDINIRSLFVFAGSLVAVGLVIHLLVVGLFSFLQHRPTDEARGVAPVPHVQAARLPPEPRIQAHPAQDLKDMRFKEDQELTSYGWVDQKNGIVRIPIERAMKLVVDEGLPARSQEPEKPR